VSQSSVGAGRAKRLFGKNWLKLWLCGFCQCALQQVDGVRYCPFASSCVFT